MSRQQTLSLGLVVMLVMLFLMGCGGGAPNPVAEAPVATSTPEQVVETPTPEPPADTPTPEPPTSTPEPPPDTPTPEPPTDTPTPKPPTETPTPEVVDPQPGAILTGNIEFGEKAGNATISLEVSDDGASIAAVFISLIGPIECPDVSMGDGSQLGQGLQGPLPIIEGSIEAMLPAGGELTGRFTSPTEASGTIGIGGFTMLKGIAEGCEWGTQNWSAEVKE